IGRSSTPACPATWRAGVEKEAGPVRCRQLKSAKIVTPIGTLWATSQRASRLHGDATLDHGHRVGLHRHHARRRHHFAGANIKLAVVEIAFDDIAIDIALRKRAGAMRAQVVGDEEFAIDIEYRQCQIVDLDLKRGAGRDLAGGAEIETFGGRGHRYLGENQPMIALKMKAVIQDHADNEIRTPLRYRGPAPPRRENKASPAKRPPLVRRRRRSSASTHRIPVRSSSKSSRPLPRATAWPKTWRATHVGVLVFSPPRPSRAQLPA